MDLQVIDDCLPNYYFKRIQKTLLEDTNFPWYWQDGSNFPMEPDFFQFNHVFIDENLGLNSKMDLFNIMTSTLQVKIWRRIKANLNTRTTFKRFHGWHSDFPDSKGYGPGKTAILYVNTNNGYTRFKKGGKVKCVENRLAIFDSYLLHSGVTCTDKKRKVVVNFNYE